MSEQVAFEADHVEPGDTNTEIEDGRGFLRRETDHGSTARFTLYSHQLAKLDRFVAQARRRSSRSGEEFAGVAVEINAAGVVSAHAPNMVPLVL